MKTFLLVTAYFLFAFLFCSFFTQWAENYEYWLTDRWDMPPVFQSIIYYLLPFGIYLVIRFFISSHTSVFIVSFLYVWMLFIYASWFADLFSNKQINIYNLSQTYVFWLYSAILLYFLADLFYSIYKIGWQIRVWIRNWGWKFRLK